MTSDPSLAIKTLERLMHEMRRLNAILKTDAEHLTRCASGVKNDPSQIRHYADSIFETSYAISLWLDIFDFENNPDTIDNQEVAPRSIHGKFKKIIRVFKRHWKPKSLGYVMRGDAHNLVDTLPCIDVVPYILLDNASKYSPRNSSVEIEFFESELGLEVKVSSLGPLLEHGELEKIFNDGYRGVRAQLVVSDGHGKGLAIAKSIMDLHSSRITATVAGPVIRIDDHDFQDFCITLFFPNRRQA